MGNITKKLSLVIITIAIVTILSSCSDDSDNNKNLFSDDRIEATNDCYCEVSFDFTDDEIIPLYSDDKPTVSDYNGECEDITFADLPNEYAAWKDGDDLGLFIKCHSK